MHPMHASTQVNDTHPISHTQNHKYESRKKNIHTHNLQQHSPVDYDYVRSAPI